MKRLVFGVGVMDADYVVGINETIGYDDKGQRLRRKVWICPFYLSWVDMLRRCYSERLKARHPSYLGCYSIPEWHHFMQYRAWMETQDWEGKQLDKDILFPGNKLYSPETCVFVDQRVNKFATERQNDRGDWPIGVYFKEKVNKFSASCMSVLTGKRKYLGSYNTPDEAHQAWLSYKLEQARILASQQIDPRVAKALIDRYENYQS